MFLEIFRFELRQQLRAPLFWIAVVLFATVAFSMSSTDAVTIGGASGNVLRNAPLVIARMLAIFEIGRASCRERVLNLV